jgi:ATP-dependent protease HslVU (ClpYQ) peptidase subunit
VKVYVVVVVLSIAGDHVPLILLFDGVGNINEPPEQIAGIGSNVGVVPGVTVTVSVAVVAHCPAVGVKVYVVVVVLSIAGDHVPLILLFDGVGNVNEPPEQIAGIGSNVGVVPGVTVTVSVAVVAHCPAVGVKVYVVVVVLSIAGDHVPLILLFDGVGNVNEPPEQIAGIGSNVGVVPGVTVTVSVAVVAHCPASGVNV